MQPREFLRSHAPFSELSRAGLDAAESALQITWAERGEQLADAGQAARWLWLIRKGSVRLQLDGQQVEDLGPGELVGLSTAAAGTSRFDAVCDVDCLLFRWPADVVRRLVDSEARFGAFFITNLAERLRALADSSAIALRGGELEVPVGTLVARPPVVADDSVTVAEAAQRMTSQRVSSLLLRGASGSVDAIITDRDLRSRVLAHGRQAGDGVAQFASSPLIGTVASTPAAEALMLMVRHGIHHLAVRDDDGAITGVVTPADLLRHHQRSPVTLLGRIGRANDSADLRGYADDLTEIIADLVHRGVHAETLGRVVAGLNDALTARLVALACSDLGIALADIAWINYGSAGRHEQGLLTDQDNALVLGDGAQAPADRFAELAERVVADLETVGIPRCRGGYMATRWTKPLGAWVELVQGWSARPDPQAMLDASNILDFRVSCGGLDLQPLEQAIAAAARNTVFMAHLLRAALQMRPPLGLFGSIRDPQGLDLKAAALMPIVGIARVVALEAGAREGSTLRRLAAAERAGVLASETSQLLSDAFELVFSLRVEHQLRQRRDPSIADRLDLDSLPPAQRRHLADALRGIRDTQTSLARRYGVDQLG